ncbi:hypothetical protein Q3G72_028417 [Acer saccharum]|nr:hypothetical protein Q3G72_028417 [Acer saccharum]
MAMADMQISPTDDPRRSPGKEQQAAGVGILLQIMMLVLSFVLGSTLSGLCQQNIRDRLQVPASESHWTPLHLTNPLKMLLWWLPFVFLQCFTSVVLLNIRPSLAIIWTDPERYHSCSIPFHCGKISVGYPFWGEDRPKSCGHPDFGLRCEDSMNSMTTIVLNQVSYYVKDIDVEAHVLKIASTVLYYGGFCYYDQLQSHPHINITEIDSELFQYVTGYRNLTVLYGCPFSATHPGYLNCTREYMSSSHSNVFIQTGDYGSERCNYSVTVPVAKNTTLVADALQEAIYEGFELKWDLSSKACEDCRNSSGSCGYDQQLVCYCPNLTYDLSASVCANSSLPIIQSPASTGHHRYFSWSKRRFYSKSTGGDINNHLYSSHKWSTEKAYCLESRLLKEEKRE